MTPDMIITSGKLELFATGILPPDEMKEMSLSVTAKPMLTEELNAIEAALQHYGKLHAPPLKQSLLNDILKRIQTLPEEIPEPVHQPAAEKKRETERVKKDKKPVIRRVETKPLGSNTIIYLTVFLIALGGALAFYFYRQWKQADSRLEALESNNAILQLENEKLISDYEASKAELEIYRDPQHKVVPLKGQNISPASEAVVYWNPANGRAYLRVQFLPEPPEGKHFYLWAVTEEGEVRNMGKFNLLNNRLPLKPMNSIKDARAFLISLEPAAGDGSLTQGAIYVVGSL